MGNGSHDGRNKDGWAEAFQKDVGEWLEDGIGDEEDGEGGVELRDGKAEIFGQAGDLCVTNVCAVQEGEQVENTELSRLLVIFVFSSERKSRPIPREPT